MFEATVATCPVMHKAIAAYDDGKVWDAFQHYRESLRKKSDNDEHIQSALDGFIPAILSFQLAMEFGLQSYLTLSVEDVTRWARYVMCTVVDGSEGFKGLCRAIEGYEREEGGSDADEDFFRALDCGKNWAMSCYYNTAELDQKRVLEKSGVAH